MVFGNVWTELLAPSPLTTLRNATAATWKWEWAHAVPDPACLVVLISPKGLVVAL